MNQQLKQFCTKGIVPDEGLMLKLYKDSEGIFTIGIGRNVQNRGISEEEAYYLFYNDIDLVYTQLQQHDWFLDLDDIRKYVLMNMCFNLGINKLLQFSEMIEALNDKDYEKAAKEMLESEWANQVKGRAVRLSNSMRDGILNWD